MPTPPQSSCVQCDAHRVLQHPLLALSRELCTSGLTYKGAGATAM